MSAAAPAAEAADALDERRRRVLRDLGAGPAETEELLEYGRSAFAPAPAVELPLPDEPSVEAWRGYAAAAGDRGPAPVLREALVQLRFPIAAGMSEREEYRAACRRGVLPEDAGGGVALADPEGLSVRVHPTAAGAVPVLLARAREDFETLVRALTRKNEPSPVPPSMGACMVGGYVNWGRVAELRRRFGRGEPVVEGAADWNEAFRAIRERKELYQDRFVILSSGAYSGVGAEEMEMEPGEWSRASIAIRLEHECTHYLTRRLLGSMRNRLQDELLADYAGIVAAAGRFRADWFLRFLGVGGENGCRTGGRLWNYRGDPPLSDAAFAVLCRLARAAAAAVEAMDRRLGAADRTVEGRARVVLALAERSLEELAEARSGSASGR